MKIGQTVFAMGSRGVPGQMAVVEGFQYHKRKGKKTRAVVLRYAHGGRGLVWPEMIVRQSNPQGFLGATIDGRASDVGQWVSYRKGRVSKSQVLQQAAKTAKIKGKVEWVKTNVKLSGYEGGPTPYAKTTGRGKNKGYLFPPGYWHNPKYTKSNRLVSGVFLGVNAEEAASTLGLKKLNIDKAIKDMEKSIQAKRPSDWKSGGGTKAKGKDASTKKMDTILSRLERIEELLDGKPAKKKAKAKAKPKSKAKAKAKAKPKAKAKAKAKKPTRAQQAYLNQERRNLQYWPDGTPKVNMGAPKKKPKKAKAKVWGEQKALPPAMDPEQRRQLGILNNILKRKKIACRLTYRQGFGFFCDDAFVGQDPYAMMRQLGITNDDMRRSGLFDPAKSKTYYPPTASQRGRKIPTLTPAQLQALAKLEGNSKSTVNKRTKQALRDKGMIKGNKPTGLGMQALESAGYVPSYRQLGAAPTTTALARRTPPAKKAKKPKALPAKQSKAKAKKPKGSAQKRGADKIDELLARSEQRVMKQLDLI